MIINENLESILLEKGVSRNYILQVKQEIPYSNFKLSEFYLYYNETNMDEVILNVSVEKIKATSREGLPKDSWFELATNASVKRPDGYSSNIEENKIRESLEHFINAKSLSSYYQSLITDINPVNLIYYDKHDIYAVTSDGNHRTILAKLTNSPKIKAKVSRAYLDKNRYNMYLKIRSAIEEFDINLNKLGLHSDHLQIFYKNKSVIGSHVNGYFQYYFQFKMNNVSSLISNEENASYFIYSLKEKIHNLNQINIIKTEYIRFYKLIGWLKWHNINKGFLYLYHKIKCYSKKEQELEYNRLAFSMALQDLQVEYKVFEVNNYYITL